MSNNENATAELEYMKKAFAALEAERDAQKKEIAEKELLLEEKDEEIRGLYVAACLKFGTYTAPLAMEMVLSLRNMSRDIVKGYGMTISDRVDKGERTVRVVKRGFGEC